MITTVTLNPAIDATWFVDEFKEDIINRVTDKHEDAGGKGVNISRILAKASMDTMATGLVGGSTGVHLRNLLDDEGVKHVFVNVESGETRTNLTLFVRDGNRTIKINQSGPTVTENDLSAMKQIISNMAQHSKYTVLSGKNPPGTDNAMVIEMLKAAKRAGSGVALDSESFSMDDIIDLKPHFFKPNLLEFEQIHGGKKMKADDLIAAARALCKKGIGYIAISMGEGGLLGVSSTEAYMVTVPPIEVRSTVGAGDAVVAGFLKTLVESGEFRDALVAGAAYGTAMATTDGTIVPEQEVIHSIQKKVQAKPM